MDITSVVRDMVKEEFSSLVDGLGSENPRIKDEPKKSDALHTSSFTDAIKALLKNRVVQGSSLCKSWTLALPTFLLYPHPYRLPAIHLPVIAQSHSKYRQTGGELLNDYDRPNDWHRALLDKGYVNFDHLKEWMSE